MKGFVGVALVLVSGSSVACAINQELDVQLSLGVVALAPDVTPAEIADRVRQFTPVELSADTTLLDARQKQVVAKLVEASDILHRVFLRQVWRENLQFRAEMADTSGPGLEAAREYYDIMAGPWDRLEGNAPFLDVGPKPAGAGYYPPDLTQTELEAWILEHPDQRAAFTDYYTVIRRSAMSLIAVPYSQAFPEELAQAAALLREAAGLADNLSLRRFLELRAIAFMDDAYVASDIAWMEIEGSVIEPTIGPYEVYEDELMGWKAAFESFITLKDPRASADLEVLVSHLRDLEQALPMDDRYKRLDRSFVTPLSVADVVYTAGDARRGVNTIAFNLPNDPRVTGPHGNKNVMLRNVITAKYDKILVPIAERLLEPSLLPDLDAKAFFTTSVMHELAHGLGPDFVYGSEIPLSVALEANYSPLEEAKADVIGVTSLIQLTERGVYSDAFRRQVYVTGVASLFRCVRFGIEEAHGKGCAVQLNALLDDGAMTVGADGRFGIDFARIGPAYAALGRTLLTLEATGDRAGVEALLTGEGGLPGSVAEALGRLADVPVDIRPVYPVKRRP
ncbi:MAG: peptidase [Gemmatimonadota bacterium]